MGGSLPNRRHDQVIAWLKAFVIADRADVRSFELNATRAGYCGDTPVRSSGGVSW